MDIESGDAVVWLTLGVAALLWYVNFGLQLINFWLGMGLAASLLALWAWRAGGPQWRREGWNLANLAIGVASAAVLYGVFWAGNLVSRLLFDFAGPGVAAVYGIRTQAELWAIVLVLLFVTSPAEEIFWRGYVQREFAGRWGPAVGWLVGAAVYAAVHLSSLNPMLVLAALVGGLFWGAIYWWRGSVVPNIISHALWTVAVFVLFPLA